MLNQKNNQILFLCLIVFIILIFPLGAKAENRECNHCWCLRPDNICEHHTNEDGTTGNEITMSDQCSSYCYSRTTDGEHWRAIHCDDHWIDWNADATDPCSGKTAGTTDEGETTITGTPISPIEPTLQIPDFNVQFSQILVSQEGGGQYITVSWLAEYIAAIYRYLVGAATILAIVMIMYGGFRWITAAGDAGKIGDAKKTIIGATVGLALALGSYAILNLINPDLVSFKSLRLALVERVEADWSPLTPAQVAANEVWLETAPPEAIVTAPVTPGEAVEPTEFGKNEVPYFAQFNGPWAKETCGPSANPSCKSFSGNGCRLTSYAMVLKYYFPDRDIDPGVLSRIGGCSCNAKPTSESFQEGPWDPVTSSKVKLNEAKQLVNEGKPIVVLCRPCVGLNKNHKSARQYKGHYMVLTGYNPSTDEFSVNDPGAGANKRIRYQTSDMLKNPCDYANLNDEKIKERCDENRANPMLYYLRPVQ